MRKRFLFVSVILSGWTLAQAGSFGVYWENDSRFHKPNGKNDRHYTNGSRIVYTATPEWPWLEDFGTWWGFGNGDPVDTAVGLSLGQNIYTPDHIGAPSRRDKDDMEYAGWLYSGLFAQRATDHQLEHFELKIGIIGPSSLADNTQEMIHRWLNADEPRGWNGQLDDEPTFDFIYRSKRKIREGPLADIDNFELIPEYGFTVGSVHRHVALGFLFRYGWNLPADFGPGRLDLPTTSLGTSRDAPDTLYLYCRTEGRLVEHNRFLTGLDAEPFVGRLQVGLTYRHKSLELGYSQTFLTREFGEQHGKDSFGAFTVTYLF